MILAAACLALILGAAAWQLSTGNLFGSKVKKSPETTVLVVETTVAAADTTGAAETTKAVPESTFVPVESTVAETTLALGSTIAAPTGPPVTVTGTGIGDWKFGADATIVAAGLTKLFGPPTSDTGWIDQSSPCDEMGKHSRDITWGWINVGFSDGPTQYAPANTKHLSSISVFDPGDGSAPPNLLGVDGKALLGTTLADLQARFPGVVSDTNEITGPSFDRADDGLAGGLTSLDPTGTVDALRAGNVCID